MAENLKQIMWGEGVAFAGGLPLFEMQELTINFGLSGITFQKGDGGGEIVIPTGQPLKARVGYLGLNASVLATMTGGSVATGTKKRIRKEQQTVATNAITLDHTPIANTLLVVEDGANKIPLKQVTTPAAADEYSISTATITFNTGTFANGTVINVWYVWADASSGETVTVGPNDLPSNFELYATLRTREQFGQTTGDIIAYFSSVDRALSDFSVGGGIGSPAQPGIDLNINNNNEGDVQIAFP